MADQFAANDVFRISFDGANNATTATDELGHALTFNGSAKLSNVHPKFGATSASFDNTTNCTIDTELTSDLDFGNGDWCIDFWLKQASAALGLIHIYDSLGAEVGYFAPQATTCSFQWGSGGNWISGNLINQVSYSTGFNPHSGEYNHIALVRYGSLFTVYVNGSSMFSATISTAMSGTGPYRLGIGGRNGGTTLSGFIDSFRVTKGQARWTGPFVPPVDGSFNSLETSFVSETVIGPRTKKISAYGATNFDSVISQTVASIVSMGWDLYDVHYKGYVYTVFRSLNLDGLTYKYAMILWDKTKSRFMLTSMESWSLSTKAVTNECYTSNRTDGWMTFSQDRCDITIFCTSRYLGLMSTWNKTNASVWSVVTEIEREAPEDTAAAGYPCWGLVNSQSLLAGPHNAAAYFSIRIPRTRDGYTDKEAASFVDILTAIGNFGWAWGAAVASGRWGQRFVSSNTQYRSMVYGWDVAKRWVSDMKIMKTKNVTDAPIVYYGRMFGVKAAPVLGPDMTTYPLNVDSSLFMAKSAGDVVDHWVLPTHFCEISGCNLRGYYHQGIATSGPVLSAWPVGQALNALVLVGGTHIYSATGAGVYKTDLVGGGGTSLIVGTTGVCLDCCYDGRFVYATTTNGLYMIDTQNGDTLTSSAALGVGGLRAVAWNGKGHLWASARNAQTAQILYKIECQTMTAAGTVTMTGNQVTASIIPGIACDDQLQKVGFSTGNMTTAADNRFGLVNTITSAGAYTVSTGSAQDQFGCSFTGLHFSCMSSSSGASPGVTTNTFTVAGVNAALVPCASALPGPNTVGTNNRVTSERQNTYHITCASSATAAQKSFGFYGLVPDYQGAGHTTHFVGTQFNTPANSAAKFILWPANMYFVAGNDTNLYMIGQINQRSYSDSTYPNVLIPK